MIYDPDKNELELLREKAHILLEETYPVIAQDPAQDEADNKVHLICAIFSPYHLEVDVTDFDVFVVKDGEVQAHIGSLPLKMAEDIHRLASTLARLMLGKEILPWEVDED